MKSISTRRGSALLIVLGMMSFIVVSAVAFSAYMRYSRLPSSYLRRTSSTRLLVKAALAEAIEEIDCAIGNNPYPGVGTQEYAYPRGENAGDTRNRNCWRDRVYIGDLQPASVDSTVSSLSLEGLAYIPAPYVNEARYWSRRSHAGSWKTLAFDAGRYAFTAINVSDCFDVNRMTAEAGRDSSDENRVSLAHCFENSEHTDYEVDPAEWDNFMSDYRDKAHAKVPLVSVADLNLAIDNRKPGGLQSPFGEYLRQGKSAKFVKDNTAGDADVEMTKAMAFVTDSLYPVTNRVASAIDLSREKDQPLYGYRAGKASADSDRQNEDEIDDIIDGSGNRFLQRYAPNLRLPELVQLYDYLDRDSVPLTLALPTVERTPMITGVAIEGKLSANVKLKKTEEIAGPNSPTTGNPSYYHRVRTYSLALASDSLMVGAGFVYPFKYNRGPSKSFKAQAAVTIALVPESDSNARNRMASVKAPVLIGRNDWNEGTRASTFGSGTPVVISLVSAEKLIALPGKVTREDDAVLEDVDFDFDFNQTIEGEFPASTMLGNVAAVSEKGAFRYIERLDADKNPLSAPAPEFATSIRPVAESLDKAIEMEPGVNYVPVVQVWVRVKDANGEIVDLVPACVADDKAPSEFLSNFSGSAKYPLLRFTPAVSAANALVNDAQMIDYGSQEFDLSPKAYVAADPRFNYAPENLMAVNALGGTLKATWLNTYAHANDGDRDGDIFMTTSDAGYLQSAYELTALVDMSSSLGNGADRSDTYSGGQFNGKRRANFNDLAANRSMWRTYSQYDNGRRKGDIAHLDLPNGTKGFRVNPYTEDPNIMMAALANTPLDWWAASTNFVNDAEKKNWKKQNKLTGGDVVDLDKANDHAFSKLGNSPAQMTHGKIDENGNAQSGTLMELAKKLMNQLRGSTSWESQFDAFGWDDGGVNVLGGVNLGVPIHSVDRKFLHGFWRECLANRQQLFLVFVRAEPMMMGGGGMGQTPPQLGARAVALVWRDPNPTPTDNAGQPRPHRTRLLFYRQCD